MLFLGSTEYFGPDTKPVNAKRIIIHPSNDQSILLNELPSSSWQTQSQ